MVELTDYKKHTDRVDNIAHAEMEYEKDYYLVNIEIRTFLNCKRCKGVK